MSYAEFEDCLIESFKRGMNEAIEDIDDLSLRDVDPVLRQKFMLNAIREFGQSDNITTKWYLNGDVVEYYDDSSVQPYVTPTGASEADIPSIEDIRDYQTENIEEHIEYFVKERTFDFLREYYTKRDGPYFDVYLKKLDVYEFLKRCTEALDPSANENREYTLPENPTHEFQNEIEELKTILLQYSAFRKTLPYLTEFERASSEAIAWFENGIMNQHEGEMKDLREYANLFGDINGFFYNSAWRVPSLIIGYQTVAGPREEDVRIEHKQNINGMKTRFISEYSRFRGACNSKYSISPSMKAERLPPLRTEDTDALPHVGQEWVSESSIDAEKIERETISGDFSDDPAFNVLS